MWRAIFILLFTLMGCVNNTQHDNMVTVKPDDDKLYSVATIQKITDKSAPVHVYIEGDGRAFNARGRATSNPTPHATFMRDMAANDKSSNVVYIARPCQFIMDEKCTKTDWTDGRFSKAMVDSVAYAIKAIAKNRPVILIGYSGGAMISGLVIQNYPDINTKQWITIAGVLNHDDWTKYFGDSPLKHSLNLNTLPRISQVHYIAENDKTVPNDLSRKWIVNNELHVIQNAAHDTIPIINLEFIR